MNRLCTPAHLVHRLRSLWAAESQTIDVLPTLALVLDREYQGDLRRYDRTLFRQLRRLSRCCEELGVVQTGGAWLPGQVISREAALLAEQAGDANTPKRALALLTALIHWKLGAYVAGERLARQLGEQSLVETLARCAQDEREALTRLRQMPTTPSPHHDHLVTAA